VDFRLATPDDYSVLEPMVVDGFEPITWVKMIDEKYGPLNGVDWRQRWKKRFRGIFDSQTVLIGEIDGKVVACATGTLDAETKLGYIDILAVASGEQGKGYGRTMLRGMLDYFRAHGAKHAHLECLVWNDAGNCLYRSEGFEEVARSIRWFVKL